MFHLSTQPTMINSFNTIEGQLNNVQLHVQNSRFVHVHVQNGISHTLQSAELSLWLKKGLYLFNKCFTMFYLSI